jgi:pyridoxal/pyridoxine/pyridoxamine kinase
MAGDNDKEDGLMIKVDFPEVVGKFSGCGDLFTAVFGGKLTFYISTV